MIHTRLRGTALALLALLVLLVGCSVPRAPLVVHERISLPEPGEVAQVVFLVGDAGQARMESYPIMPRVRDDIEWWAERLEADSAVSVLFLGDIVYPLGLHPPGSDLFPHDSAIVMDQVQLLAGPASTARQAHGYFMAGNHDWGLKTEWEGFVRLKTLDDFLGMARQATGAHAHLVPEAGTGGPYVVDVGDHVRLLLLDTAWWLLDEGSGGAAARDEVLRKIEEAIVEAGAREVLIAAHHPFKSVGPHGGGTSFWSTLGVRYLLTRSGAILQDLTSVPYRELSRGLRLIFERTGPVLAFIGGHEHSLQVIGAVNETDPTYSIVSGSASKISSIGTTPGMRFAHSAPGYMRLFIMKDGGLRLFVEAAPVEFRACSGSERARAECMSKGVASFETVYSQRLR